MTWEAGRVEYFPLAFGEYWSDRTGWTFPLPSIIRLLEASGENPDCWSKLWGEWWLAKVWSSWREYLDLCFALY